MRRRKSAIFFLVLGICLIALAVALNVGWILLNLREIVLMIVGIIFFALIITGLILNMIFLLREIKRNEQQDAFLNAVTHELKTPIASLKLYLETLKTRNVSEEKRREFYDIMLTDSNRLLSTVEKVLQASRTREKNRELNISRINLNELLTDTVKIIHNAHKLDENCVSFAKPESEITVSGDRNELQTIFLNLLENALKYSSAAPKIFVSVKEPSSNKVEISIKDNGIGIAPTDLRKIFDRFYRVSNGSTQAKKGTGLGLSIVESIVKKHNGKVWAESKGEGKGSIFFVQLPKENL